MSHIVTIETKLRDPEALAAACRRLGLATPIRGTTTLFSGEVTGQIVQLPEWQYPIVVDTATGTVKYDNYNGQWGDPTQLDGFIQAYAVEKTKIEARRKGHQIHEQALQDGSIKIQIIEGF
jgi:hypothetical protein